MIDNSLRVKDRKFGSVALRLLTQAGTVVMREEDTGEETDS